MGKRTLSFFLIIIFLASTSIIVNGKPVEEMNIEELREKISELKKELDEVKELLSNPFVLSAIEDWTAVLTLQGAHVYGQDYDNTFLGVIDFVRISPDSIFNVYSQYGSSYGNNLWNTLGQFGSPVSQYSAFNSIAASPPMIMKHGNIIGYITVNPLFKYKNAYTLEYLVFLVLRLEQ